MALGKIDEIGHIVQRYTRCVNHLLRKFSQPTITDRQKKWTLTRKVDLNSKFEVETFLIGTIEPEVPVWCFITWE